GAGEAVAPAGAVADLVVVASEPVPAPVAAGPAPEPGAGPTADRGPAEPAGRTSVVGCTGTTPAGAGAVTGCSVELHCMPRRLRRVRAASAVGKSGPRSRGSSVTESPTRTTLPSSAERSTRSATSRPAAGMPWTSIDCAPVTAAAR